MSCIKISQSAILPSKIIVQSASFKNVSGNEGLASTGNILLDKIGGRTYNEDTPATGNITIDTTNSVIGGRAIKEHNDSIAPIISIIPSILVKHVLGSYIVDELNEIYFYKKSNKIIIKYTQPTVIGTENIAPNAPSGGSTTNITETTATISWTTATDND